MENNSTIFNPPAAVCRPRSACANRFLPLSMTRTGETVRVKNISGSDETRRFLGNMGFVENAEVSVVSEINDSVIVSVKGTRVAVSRAMAGRILTI